ncbi:MAG: tRNA (N(6)-L-threonylcarbamoyladenosine(37)-C(2))-methylthiotransferase MtaB [Clostridia bacterium]|nr:tRNA (N(6)-L-threonylcarbamoyladenosine(37)-C(2))-methylthiotransferase MtaB [Clostridia bacterium]
MMEFENKKPRAAVYTLGCRVNQYESDAVEEELKSLGFEVLPFTEACDVYIINTCAVTAESERKSKQIIRRASAANPDAYILVMGCFSQIKAEAVAGMKGVDYVCGNRNKLSVSEFAAKLVRSGKKEKNADCKILDVESAALESMTVNKAYRDRCYIKIEDGCDNHCTYCIIKKARGNVVSRAPEDVLAEVAAIAKDGCSEVVLTGIEAASYGRDIGGYPLSRLMAQATEIDGIERVRAGSLEPSVMTKAFCDELAGTNGIMPSFHLSLQSGSNRILAAMKRKYNREQVLRNVEYMKSVIPGVTFTCDIIVGFPGETEEDFQQTVDIAEKIDFLHMHIFPFSPREGTLAATMKDQVPEAIKKERAHRLGEIGKKLSEKRYLRAVGEKRSVLFESRMGEYYYGHAEDMLEVIMKTDEELQGKIFSVKLMEYDGKHLIAEEIKEG